MLKLLICGDLTTRGRGLNALQNGMAFSGDIVKYIVNDYTIVNLESPVADELDVPIHKIGPALKLPKDTIKYLKDVGVNAVTLANNHFYDYGESGVEKTISALTEYEIEYVGTAKDRILSLPEAVILNYCEREFSVNEEKGASPINPITIFYDIAKVKAQMKPIIVIVHGGHEGYNLPSPRMKELYRFIIDCGASVVINHHQHCYSGFEKYHNGLIFYGLGNFFFDIDSSNPAAKLWNDGYMVELELCGGRIEKHEIIPYKQCLPDAPTCRLMNSEEKTAFENNICELNSIIANDNELNKKYSNFIDNFRTFQLGNFTPYTNRILLGLYRRHFLPSFLSEKKKLQILNMLRCESHRDLAIQSLLK